MYDFACPLILFVILNSWLVPPVEFSSFTSIVWKLCRTSLFTQDFSFESLEMFAQREKTSQNQNIVALVVWKRPGAEWCWHGSWVLQSLHHERTMSTWSEKRVIFLCAIPGLTWLDFSPPLINPRHMNCQVKWFCCVCSSLYGQKQEYTKWSKIRLLIEHMPFPVSLSIWHSICTSQLLNHKCRDLWYFQNRITVMMKSGTRKRFSWEPKEPLLEANWKAGKSEVFFNVSCHTM